MDDIWDAQKLVLFIAFFIPGFIAIKAYDLFAPSERREAPITIIEAITYSCLNYALLSWLIYLDWHFDLTKTRPELHIAVLFVVLFLFPVGLGLGFFQLRVSRFVSRFIPHPIPKPWDYVFGKREAYWVIAELSNGSRVGGMFDDESYASGFPHEEQIYLQQLWQLDGRHFVKPIERSSGALISAKDIRQIEFFK